MNSAHLHLLFNHVPILGSFFGLVLLAFGVFQRQAVLVRAALFTLLAAALLGLPAQLSGEGAEELVEDLPGVSHALIHAHEEAAELGYWCLTGTAALAILSLQMLRRQSARATLLVRLTLLAALLSFGLLARGGYLGGLIRHPEAYNAPTPSSVER